MSWSKETSLARIRDVGSVPIVRAPSPEDALLAAGAIVEGNIGIAEITTTVPNALQVLQKVADKSGRNLRQCTPLCGSCPHGAGFAVRAAVSTGLSLWNSRMAGLKNELLAGLLAFMRKRLRRQWLG